MKSLLEEKIPNGPLLSVFFFAKTQTHTTHTLSTPAVAEYLPASQPWHVSAPAVLESLPASQSVQEVAPEVAAENFPAKNHRTLTMRESCTCCVSSTGERQRNLLHRSYKSEIHHSTDQPVLLRSTPMTHTTHTPVHCQ